MSFTWENNILVTKANQLAHLIYLLTKSFPPSEKFGLVSQLRRAAISVVLNIIEGYARFRTKSHINFLEIAFGSLKETQYLIEFCFEEMLITEKNYQKAKDLCDEVARILYSKMRTLRSRE